MYVAVRTLKVMSGNQVVEVLPGSPVDVSTWSDFVVRAHIKQGLIERAGSVDVTTTVKKSPTTSTPTPQPKKTGAKAASL